MNLPLRIGLAAIGHADDPGLWSGTPSNIARALRLMGVDVVPLDVTSPAMRFIADATAVPVVLRRLRRDGLHTSVDRGRIAAQQSMLLSRARSVAGRCALRRAGHLDAVIQIGTGYRVAHPRVVSYEDMTIPQAIREPEALWRDVPARRRRARVRQQASAYRRLTGAAFATRWAASSAVVDLACNDAKARVIGIGPNFVAADSGARSWTHPRFLFVGREWGRKNGASVVSAFHEVHSQYPDAELHLAGDHPRIDVPGVTGHGYLSLRDPAGRRTVSQLWATATCCVVPSRFEPAGIIYVEAMHAGIPSIGTTRGGAAELIGEAGVAVDPYSQRAIADAMLHYCDPATARTVGIRARQRSTTFTWEHVARGLLAALGFATFNRT